MFPDNPTQWLDEDGDGLGDNQSGTDGHPFLNDFDNDINDAIDILPKLSSPGDLDADGCLDEVDISRTSQECITILQRWKSAIMLIRMMTVMVGQMQTK